MMGNWGGWGPGFGWIFMILVLVLIVVGIAALAKWFSSSGGPGAGADMRPLDILKERYARGDITREQYEQMRRDLES